MRLMLGSTVLLLATLAIGARAPAQGGTPDAAAVARGKALYDKVGCWGCHGTVGQGGIGPMAGPRISSRSDLPLEAFAYFVRNPVRAMPPFTTKVLSDAQLADIHAYVQTAFKPNSVENIPMLREAK